jgi:hypothetical protein
LQAAQIYPHVLLKSSAKVRRKKLTAKYSSSILLHPVADEIRASLAKDGVVGMLCLNNKNHHQ